MVATLSLLLVLGVSAARLLGAITDIGIQTARQNQGRASVQRLAKSFRLDIHDADNVGLRDNDWPIELSTAGTTIRYEWNEKTTSIQRWVSDGETRLAVERFQLPLRCVARISLSPEFVTLVLRDGELAQPWIIEANRQ
jgi:hypothetical protein